MKKLVLLIMVVVNTFELMAQSMVNSDFATNSGNITVTSCGPFTGLAATPKIADGPGQFPNWRRMTGTPNFETSTSHPNDIRMSFATGDDQNTTEGIIGGYQFVTNGTYEIHIGMHNSNNQALRLIATDHSISTNDCDFQNCAPGSSLNGVIPSQFQPNPVTDAQSQEIAHGTLNSGDNTIFFTANKDMDFIVIFPDKHPEFCNNDIIIEYVRIVRLCVEDFYIYDLVIPGGVYNHAKRIHVGSSGGPNPITQSLSDIVECKAAQFVNVHENFLAAPDEGHYFLAEIKSCPYYDPSPGGRLAFNAPQQPEDSRGPELDNSIKVYPNPNSGTFNIQLPVAGDYDLKVINMLGALVYNGNLKGQHVNSLTLPADLASGSYTVRITGQGMNYQEKIAVVK